MKAYFIKLFRVSMVCGSMVALICQAVLAEETAKTSTGYPYQFRSEAENEKLCARVSDPRYPEECERLGFACEPKPTLKITEVVDIAEKAGLLKPKDGYWYVEYSRGSGWRVNPFLDHCIWVVRTMEASGAEDAAVVAGRGSIYIADITKKYWAPYPMI